MGTLYLFLYGETAKPANHRHVAYRVFSNFRRINTLEDPDPDPRLQQPRRCGAASIVGNLKIQLADHLEMLSVLRDEREASVDRRRRDQSIEGS